jgi:hypothetical protein
MESNTSPQNIVSIEVPSTLHIHIDGALVRLHYLYPEQRFTKSETGLQINVSNDCNATDLATNVRQEIYREKIYAETLPMRRSLYTKVFGQ